MAKQWRKNARKTNSAASKEEGAKVTHTGRANKTGMYTMPGVSPFLVQSLLIRAAENGNFKLTFSKKELEEITNDVLESILTHHWTNDVLESYNDKQEGEVDATE